MSKSIKLLIVCILGLAILLFSTRPDTAPSVALIVPFVLIFLILFLAAKTITGATSGRKLGIAILVASIGVVFLAFQSLGQLTVRDFVMLLLLFVIGYFYILRQTTPSN